LREEGPREKRERMSCKKRAGEEGKREKLFIHRKTGEKEKDIGTRQSRETVSG
jgi:hypothetical protein